MIRSLKRYATAVLLLASLFTVGQAWADAEPSLNQVYAAAEAGKLEEAQVMMQQVLVAHPHSAKAHYVRAELFARQGQFGPARDALAEAEKIAPDLPFAKPEAVRALHKELAGSHTNTVPAGVAYAAAATSPMASSTSWVLPLLLAVGVIGVGYLVFRRRAPAAPSYTMAGATSQPVPNGSYGQAMPTYGQPASSGLGGQIMGGVATGLAVGAGVMAAEAIGRRLFSDGDAHAHSADAANTQAYEPVQDVNVDMGGQNFGLNDASSWDDGGAASDSGGWDN
jgi:tetratricopeptide (TPR) repeat protein